MNMVERVGMVIMKADGCGATNDAGKRVFCDDVSLPEKIRWVCECRNTARAAIEAMRSPTQAMDEAGDSAFRDGISISRGEAYPEDEAAYQVYTAMIDAALKD